MIKDRLGDMLAVGDFILYVTKTESPSIQFGWVEDIVQKDPKYNTFRIKIRHANPDGSNLNKTTWVYDEVERTGTYVDTGKPSRVSLESRGQKDNRFMKFQPI